MTSLEGGAGVGSGLGKVYKSPPPSAPLNRGPLKARSASGGHSSRLLPGGGSGSGGSERAPGLERSGQRTPSCEDYPGKWLSPWWEPRRGALAAEGRSARRQIRAAVGLWPASGAGSGRAGRVALTMVSCWDTGLLLCALLGGLLLTGEARSGPEARAGPARGGGRAHPWVWGRVHAGR